MERRSGCLWLLVGLFLALIAGGLAFTVMLRTTSSEPADQAEPRAPVVIVAQDVPPRTRITAEDLITKEIPLSAIPENAVGEQEQVIGKVATSQLIAGQMLLGPHIAEPGQQVNFQIEKGQVVMAFPADDLMGRTGTLQSGDIIDILYTIQVEKTEPQAEVATTGTESQGEPESEQVTFWTAQQVEIVAVVSPEADPDQTDQSERKPQAILLALDPQDALVLKHLKDTAGAIVDVVLRSPEDETEFEPLPVNPQYLEEEYNLTPEQP